MDIQKNFAAMMRAQMKRNEGNIRGFSEALGISPAALQEYLNGDGNPRLKTIGHIAAKLDIEPAMLLTGDPDLQRRDVLLILLDTLHCVSELNNEGRQRFAEYFREMMRLWDGTE